MNIFAVYKTFRGHEFARESLLSIYPFISGALFVHEDTGWLGRKGNTVRDVIKATPDPDKKVYHLDLEGQVSQNDQYDAAVDWLENKKTKYDYILLVDSDEVWTEEDYARAEPELEHLLKNKNKLNINSIHCRQYDYIKSPFFRVDPPGVYRQTNFILKRAIRKGAINVRGMNIKPAKVLEDVFWHHFPMVRNTLTEVLAKQTDSNGIENELLVDLGIWVHDVWNKLPNATNMLPHANNPGYWKGIKVVGLEDLPKVMHDNPIVKAWQKYPAGRYGVSGSFNGGAELLKKYGLPPGFGPGHPDYKVPSKRNRYEQAMLEASRGK